MTDAPVLFLPGMLCDERIWLPVWRQLALPQRRYVPLQWASSFDDMLALTGDRVLPDEKVHVIGFSMGGYVAATWALQNPGRVASLTLIGYNPEGLGTDELKRRKELVSALQKGQPVTQTPAYTAQFVAPDFVQEPLVAGVMQQMAQDLGSSTLLAHIQSTTPRQDLTPQLRQAAFPINLIAARQDLIARYELISAITPNLNNCTLYSIEQAAHMMLLERPDEVSSALGQILA
ncbi:alpha/beta fold hydrolase [Salinimonas marina]|uniref:alpha/beta fold hydrolase n=1 Tax=Salinimonas marina TaxID=2785918 RepID=UPI001E43832F|nr:alpha/beta fold hydrolase [Salinimonas marina]